MQFVLWWRRLGDWLIKVGVPNLQAFIDGLTGQRGVTIAISEANEGAYQFGERLKKIFETVYRLKEEFAALAGVIASLWAAAKIAAFVQGIAGLVKAFQAWRTAAAAAAVATAAATGGVSAGAALAGAAAVATGLAIALSQFKSEGEGDFTDGGVGLGNRPLGGMAGISGGGGAGSYGGGFSGASGTTAGGAVSTPNLGGFGSVEQLTNRLFAIQDEITSLTFKYQTGQISKTQAQSALDKLKAEMGSIERITGRLAQNLPSPGLESISGGVARGEYAASGVTVIVQAPSVIDETGFTRAVVDALNSVERRQGGGASALVGL